MSEQNTSEGKSILQRVTQIFVGGPKASKPPVAEVVAPPEQPLASDEQKEERLAAYRKLCEEEAQNNPSQEQAEKKIKYRAKDFNASESHAKQKAV